MHTLDTPTPSTPMHNGTPREPLPTPPSVRPVADALKHESQQLGSYAKALFDRSAAAARDGAVAVRREASQIGARGERYIRDEPVKSVLIAAAAGAVLSVVLSSMLSRR